MNRFPTFRAASRLALLVLLAAATGGCFFGLSAEEKLRNELLALSKEETFEKGKQLVAQGKWEKGRKYLAWVYENYGSDPIAREALLRLADSYYDEGKDTSYIEGLYRYRDYQSRYPNRPESDYVLMRIGDCQLEQAGSPDRDQSTTMKALQQYQELLRIYPKTTRRDEVVERIRRCRGQLAEHELAVARFYVRRGFPDSAAGRLGELLSNFPDFQKTDEALYWMVRACRDAGQLDAARTFRRRLENDFPESEWTDDAPKIPPPPELPPPDLPLVDDPPPAPDAAVEPPATEN